MSAPEEDPKTKAFLDFVADPSCDTSNLLTLKKLSVRSQQSKKLIEESLSESSTDSEEQKAARRDFIRIASRKGIVVDKALDVFFTIPEEREKVIKKVPDP